MDRHISARRPALVLINKKKATCVLLNVAMPADHIGKIKDSENINKDMELVREITQQKSGT